MVHRHGDNNAALDAAMRVDRMLDAGDLDGAATRFPRPGPHRG